jgi:hypothetical protein
MAEDKNGVAPGFWKTLWDSSGRLESWQMLMGLHEGDEDNKSGRDTFLGPTP